MAHLRQKPLYSLKTQVSNSFFCHWREVATKYEICICSQYTKLLCQCVKYCSSSSSSGTVYGLKSLSVFISYFSAGITDDRPLRYSTHGLSVIRLNDPSLPMNISEFSILNNSLDESWELQKSSYVPTRNSGAR